MLTRCASVSTDGEATEAAGQRLLNSCPVVGDWAAIGEYVRRERRRRHMTQATFSEVIGISRRTLISLETAEADRYDPGIITTVEIALGWQDGSVESVLGGGKPQFEDDPDLSRIRALWHLLPADVREQLASLVESLATPRE